MNMARRIVSACLTGLSCLPFATGQVAPVYHLPFDGDLKPAAGSAFAAPQPTGEPQYVDGRTGQAVLLKGTTSLATDVGDSLRGNGFTLAFWLKPLWHADDNLVHPIVFIPPEGDRGDYMLQKGFADTVAVNHLYGFDNPEWRALLPDRWTHIAVVFDRTNALIDYYVNGKGWKQTVSTNALPSSSRVYIGGRPGVAFPADVIVDDWKVYDRPLSQTDIAVAAGADFGADDAPGFFWKGAKCDLANAVETPHRTFAKPLAGGKIKVLFVVESKRAREIVEFCQRVDIEPRLLTSPLLFGDWPPTLRHPEIFEKISREMIEVIDAFAPACIVLPAYPWNLVSDAAQTRILEYVGNGGGLLLVSPRCIGTQRGDGLCHTHGGPLWIGWSETKQGQTMEALVHPLSPSDAAYLCRNVPFHDIASFRYQLNGASPEALFRSGDYGKGRILVYDIDTEYYFSKNCLTPTRRGAFSAFEYDYTLQVPAKALLWAAGRTGDSHIESILYRTASTHPQCRKREALIGVQGEWTVGIVNSSDREQALTLHMETRQPGLSTPWSASRDLRLGPGRHAVTVGYKPENKGETFADVSLRNMAGEIVDWGVQTITVSTPADNAALEALTPDKPWYRPGESPVVAVSMRMATFFAGLAPSKGLLRWRLYGHAGRNLMRGEESVALCEDTDLLPVEKLRLPALPNGSLAYSLSVDLLVNGQFHDQATVTLRVPDTASDDLRFFVWGGESESGSDAPEALASDILRDRYRLDACTVVYHGDSLFAQALGYLADRNLRGWVYATHLGSYSKPGAVRSPDYADPRFLKSLDKFMARVAAAGAPYGPLFYSMGDETKLGPPDLKASEYEERGFVEFLKAKYQTVAGLNDAWGTHHATWTDALPAPDALSDENTHPDVRTFREGLWANAIGVGTRGALQEDPHAKVGIEGIFGLSHYAQGIDYSKLVPQATFCGLYDYNGLGATSAPFQYNAARSFAKRDALLGVWWNYTFDCRPYSLYGPWFALLNGMRVFGWFDAFSADPYTALQPDFTPTQEFLWTNEELQPLLRGIGKLYVGLERDNLGAAVLYNQRNLGRLTPEFHASVVVATMLDDLQIPYDCVDAGMVERGELAGRGVQVLILAGQRHMERATADAIKTFARDGGRVLSYGLPALSNGYRDYPASLLDDLHGDRADGAASTNWTPYGKGGACLVPDYGRDYAYVRSEATGQERRVAMQALLSAAGVRRNASLDVEEAFFQPVRLVTSHGDGNLYVSYQRDFAGSDMASHDFRLRIPAKAHLYDVVKETYLGFADSVILKGLEPGRGGMIACLTYKADALTVSGLKDACSPGEWLRGTVAMTTTGGKPGAGVFRIEVFGPSGQEIIPLRSKIRSREGKADLTLPIAFNDPCGQWTVTVTDIATGVAGIHAFALQ